MFLGGKQKNGNRTITARFFSCRTKQVDSASNAMTERKTAKTGDSGEKEKTGGIFLYP
jgi:hypothetical protein